MHKINQLSSCKISQRSRLILILPNEAKPKVIICTPQKSDHQIIIFQPDYYDHNNKPLIDRRDIQSMDCWCLFGSVWKVDRFPCKVLYMDNIIHFCHNQDSRVWWKE